MLAVVEIIGRNCKVRSQKCELGQGPWNVHSVKCLSTLRKSNFAKWSGKCKMWYLFGIVHTKGQIKSEWIYEINNFPKNYQKNLNDFCPMYCKNSQGRNPSNFSGQFLENFRGHKFILKLTDL